MLLIAAIAVGCSATNGAVSADLTATSLIGKFQAGSASTVLVIDAPVVSSESAPGEPPSPLSTEPAAPTQPPADGTAPTTSITGTSTVSAGARPGPSTTVQGRETPSTSPPVTALSAGAGPADASVAPTLALVPLPSPAADDAPADNPVPPLPTNPTTPRPVVPAGAPTVYDAGTVGEVWVCDGEADEPRTGFVFVRNPGDAQQVFIEVAARAWSAEEIVGSLMAAQASINDGHVLATGPFDPATGHGLRVESGDPVDFALRANLLTVTERPADSAPVVWSCGSVPTG